MTTNAWCQAPPSFWSPIATYVYIRTHNIPSPFPELQQNSRREGRPGDSPPRSLLFRYGGLVTGRNRWGIWICRAGRIRRHVATSPHMIGSQAHERSTQTTPSGQGNLARSRLNDPPPSDHHAPRLGSLIPVAIFM